MSDEQALPEGFVVGHWTDPDGATGCTVVIPPPGSRGGVAVMGGGPGTRETDVIGPFAGAPEANAVLLTGGSAFGLVAADGVVRWLEERGRGYETLHGRVPIVPAAVIYDLPSGGSAKRPGAEEGYAACEVASDGVPKRGAVGAGAGATVAKLLGRELAHPGGSGYAALVTGRGETVAAVAIVNSVGDVIAADGEPLASPRSEEGEAVRGASGLAAMSEMPDLRAAEGNSTLICICTDAPLSKLDCSVVARAASAGLARAIDPAFTTVDGDVVFCLASGEGQSDRFLALQVGAAAAAVTAAAIRDAVIQVAG